MTTIPTPSVATEVPALPPAERRARISALQSELERLEERRDHVRDVVRALEQLDHTLGSDPIAHRALYDRTVSACCEYQAASARLTARINALDTELTALCRRDTALEAIDDVLDTMRHQVAMLGGVR